VGQTLVIAPNESLFTYAGIQGEEKEHQIQQGALALSLNWSEEQESQSNAAGFIKSVVNAAAPNLNIAIKQAGEDISKAQSITALLVSPEAYVVALFASRPVKEAELSNALENWNSYFKALQQHQYLLGEQFSIKLLSNSVLSNEQQALAQTVRCALKRNIDTNEILQQFEGFSVDDNTESWAKVVHFSLQQYQSLISAKNENAKKDLLLNAAKNEKEGIEKALKEQHEEVKLNKQKIQVLQGELETKETEAKKNQAAIAELTQQNRDINSELAQASGENKALVAESNEQKSENELLVLQIQQLQEELEAVFTDAENSKVTIADLEVKYADINRKLAEANSETQFLIKENKVNADENALLQLQIQQLQEELEATFSKLTQVQQQLENAEQTNAQLKAATKEKQPAPEVVNTLKEKLLAAEDENALLVLQISQLQEELESIYLQFEEHKNTSAGLINKLEAKLSNSEDNGPALRKELENAMSEQELLQLQIKQLQEELEFYFTEYQKLKTESPDNKALSEFKSKIEERFPHLVLSEGVTLTGGANQKDLQRITARFTQVEHADKHWNAFSVIVNDRKGVLDVEFHAPDNKRVYPLSKFVKTGSNKVCDFSLLSPFTDAGKKALAELSAEDHLLLIGIVEELQTKLQQSDVQRTDATQPNVPETSEKPKEPYIKEE
jgi:myosin heavy subunit